MGNPATLPADFFSKPQNQQAAPETAPLAPDTLPADFFTKQPAQAAHKQIRPVNLRCSRLLPAVPAYRFPLGFKVQRNHRRTPELWQELSATQSELSLAFTMHSQTPRLLKRKRRSAKSS